MGEGPKRARSKLEAPKVRGGFRARARKKRGGVFGARARRVMLETRRERLAAQAEEVRVKRTRKPLDSPRVSSFRVAPIPKFARQTKWTKRGRHCAPKAWRGARQCGLAESPLRHWRATARRWAREPRGKRNFPAARRDGREAGNRASPAKRRRRVPSRSKRLRSKSKRARSKSVRRGSAKNKSGRGEDFPCQKKFRAAYERAKCGPRCARANRASGALIGRTARASLREERAASGALFDREAGRAFGSSRATSGRNARSAANGDARFGFARESLRHRTAP